MKAFLLLAVLLGANLADAARLNRVTLKPVLKEASRTCDYRLDLAFPEFPDYEIYRSCTGGLSKQVLGLCDYSAVGIVRSYIEPTSQGDYILHLYSLDVPFAYSGDHPGQCGDIELTLTVR
jgi:hypothetical protein